jgi:hypothetical protein
MGATTYVQPSFLGGEVSQSYQGRIDRPDYRTFMNVCLNTIPVESGAALRRPGTRHICPLGPAGTKGRVITFDFRQSNPYMLLLLDGKMRFLTGGALVPGNDAQVITAISTANPAVVTTNAAHGWSTGGTVFGWALDGASELHNRLLTITVLSPTTFSIADAVTGAAIDGAGLTAFVSGNISRVLELTTPYTAGAWAGVRSVQAEETAILLNGSPPQVLSVDLDPTATQFATFDLAAAEFLDGPYLDPIRGSWMTSSDLNGITTLTLTFQPYDASRAYDIGDYVAVGSSHYRSLTANNQNNTPGSSPANWLEVNAGDPINHGAGFTSADIGRHIRLFSEPELYDPGDTYSSGDIVAYDTGSGSAQYWKATGAISAGEQPGTSSDWAVLTPGAIWTWARVLSISSTGQAAPDNAIGNLAGGGGVAAAIDGDTTKPLSASAATSAAVPTYPVWGPLNYPPLVVVQYNGVIYQRAVFSDPGGAYQFPPPLAGPPFFPYAIWNVLGTVSNLVIDGLVGGFFNTAKSVQSATAYAPNDTGFANGGTFVLNLRAKSTAPGSSGDGVLLGTSGSLSNTFSPVTVTSNDTTSSFHYIWFEIIATYVQPLPDGGGNQYIGSTGIAQVVFLSPDAENGSVITAQIVGDPLLYNTAIRTWRLGAYGGENGWPTCGTYHEDRLWLSGVIGNRIDGSKTLDPYDLARGIFDFAPTAPSGAVADDNAITATFTAKDVNAILWMEPDQQGIICGTQAGEWLVSPSAPGALSPTNTSARRVTKIGCANIEPRRTDHTLVFVQKFRRKVMEYFADVFSGKFSAPNLSNKSKHLTTPNIAEIAWQQELAPVLWQRLDDGTLIGTTYKRDKLTTAQEPDIAGAHRHVLGSSRLVESIAVGPSVGGNLDSLTMVVNDPVTGIRYAEVMTDLLDEGFNLANCWLVDSGIAPTALALADVTDDMPYGGLTIHGLWPLNGQTVAAFIGGLDCGSTTDANGRPTIADFTVVNGSITVPFGDGVSAGSGDGLFTRAFVTALSADLNVAAIPICVGFPYVSDGQIVRPATPQETGSPAGPALGKSRRTHMFAAHLYGAITGRIKFGTTFSNLTPAIFKDRNEVNYSTQQPFSGIYQSAIEADSDFDNMLCWRVERPLPAFVIALAPNVHTQDR